MYKAQKKLLIVGGSHADIPIIQAAQELGYWVITSGNNPNDLGHKYSDEYQPEDYSKPDRILLLAKRLKIDAVCASSNDFSAISCAYTAEKLHLSGHDNYKTSLIIHHKNKFRAFSLKNHISVPKAISITKNGNIEKINSELTYPLIIKPVDLSGGKGITKVNDPIQLNQAIKQAFALTKEIHIISRNSSTAPIMATQHLLKTEKLFLHLWMMNTILSILILYLVHQHHYITLKLLLHH
jgi:biotin carboxylase